MPTFSSFNEIQFYLVSKESMEPPPTEDLYPV
jgi:hypothetical protein